MQDKETKYFSDPETGGANSDDAPFAVGTNQWVNMQDARILSTDAGVTATVESIGSTLLLSTPQPSATFFTIGCAEETERSRFCYFKKNTTGPWDKIVCWDDTFKQEFDVLLSTQVTGGLNFDKDYLIHSCRIVDGLLYWTDNLNRQRKINIDAGIKLNNPSYVTDEDAYVAPISQEVISLLKRPPMLPLAIEKVTQPSIVNNYVKNGAFQFSSRYYYKTGETSVISVYSLIANYNSVDQTFNSIDVTFSFDEYIDQDVQRVDLVVRYGETNNFYVIKSWNKNVPSELAQIVAHNNGITELSYRFYDDKRGEALDPAYAIKPFDSVPDLSETLEIARNRLFLGNNKIGKNTTITTSLTAAAQEATDGVLTAQWVKIEISAGNFHYYLDMGSFGFFDAISQPLPPPYPSTYAYVNMTYIATGPFNFSVYLASTYPGWINGIQYPGSSADITGGPAVPGLSGDVSFKSGASYQLSQNFYDFGDRKNGVITNDNLKIDIPNREYDQLNYVTGINWSLSNTNAINEIPDWAEYYSINITKCLTTRFFVQCRVKNITYATKDADGVYTFNTTAYAATLNGVAIDITSLNSQGMGYVFTQGDLVNVYISTSLYVLSIIAQDGNWLVCELQDLGTLGNTSSPKTDALFQIYTPYRPSTSEPFYEVAQKFKVLNPGTANRAYSVLAGTIGGDVTLLTRNDGSTDYLTENMSPNDTYYQNWYTDAGRTNYIDNIGQKEEQNTISYSNTFIAGSRVNGLSSFEALNEKTIPIECGSIQKLQSTSKVENQQGIVMLCICTDQTSSLYIEESQQYGSNTATNLIVFTDVIGTINVLKGNYGTINPESVIEFKGMVFWVDVNNGKVIQYSVNGLFPISEYKMTRFWKLFCDLYKSMTTEQIESLGSRPFIFTTVDPHHFELLISIPKLTNTPPKGFLPDYPSTIFPFDIWDGQGKTLVYKLSANPNRWLGSFSFNPEYFITLQNKLYSFRYGSLYLHNQTGSSNQYYGINYTAKIMVVGNKLPKNPKVYNAFAVQSNMVPLFSYLYNSYPELQTSDLMYDDWFEQEGIFKCNVRRNKVQITANGYVFDGLLTGEEMRNDSMFIMLEFDVSGQFLELKYLDIDFTVSRGNN